MKKNLYIRFDFAPKKLDPDGNFASGSHFFGANPNRI